MATYETGVMFFSEQHPVTTTDASGLSNQSMLPSDVILTVIYFVIGAIGLLGNVFVVVVIVNFRSMLRTVPNLFIINQSLIDATASLILILQFSIPVDGNNMADGLAADMFCKVWITQSILWQILGASVYNLVLVTVERYACVVHPIWHKKHVTRGRALCTLPLVWCIGFLVDSVFSYPSSKVIDGQCYVFSVWVNDSVRRLMGMHLVIFLFIIPLATFIFCYGRIASVLRSKVTRLAPAHEHGGSQTNSKSSSKIKDLALVNVLRTLVVVVLITVVTWGVSETYFALYNLGLDYPYIDFSSPAYHFTLVLTYLNCCINPFVYAAQYKKFKEGVRKLFGVKIQQNQDVSIQGSTAVHSL